MNISELVHLFETSEVDEDDLTEEQIEFVAQELKRQMIIGNEKRMELVRVLYI